MGAPHLKDTVPFSSLEQSVLHDVAALVKLFLLSSKYSHHSSAWSAAIAIRRQPGIPLMIVVYS